MVLSENINKPYVVLRIALLLYWEMPTTESWWIFHENNVAGGNLWLCNRSYYPFW